MKWAINIEGRQYIVEANYSKFITSGAGEVKVDGEVVKAWGSSVSGLPKVVSFEISGKPALLRRRGIFNQNFDLIFNREFIKKL